MIAPKDNPCVGNRLAHAIKLRLPGSRSPSGTSPPQSHHLFFGRDPQKVTAILAEV